MNYHCWRNAGTKVVDNDEKTWPKLPHIPTQERSQTCSIFRPRISQFNVDFDDCSQEIDFLENLNDIDYPRLGEIVLKRKHNFVANERSVIQDYSYNSEARRLRRHRSTDSIHINLQKTLERQGCPLLLEAYQSAKITVDICKLNVNMSVGSPLDSRWLVAKSKRSTMHIGKKKRPSRLKWLIRYDRMMRRQLNADGRKICEITSSTMPKEDISGLNFENLTINVASRDDPELVKKMSNLSCLNSRHYRENRLVDITEDDGTFRSELQEQMENMSLDATDEIFQNGGSNESNIFKGESIDRDLINATVTLKICQETGEFVDNMPIKEEPSKINFTKKFREYCTNTVTPDLRKYLDEFMTEISRLQKKMYERDSVKGKSKKRYYAGIKEIQKHIDLKKIKFVVIATDLEKVKVEGGLDDTLSKFVGTCKRYEVPYCFGLGRRKLGYYTHGNGFVSCIGIANYSGAEEKLKNVLFEVVEARNEFSRLMFDEPKIIDVEKFLPKEELLLSEIVNAYFKILASSG